MSWTGPDGRSAALKSGAVQRVIDLSGASHIYTRVLESTAHGGILADRLRP